MDNDDHTRYVKLIDPLVILAQAGSINISAGTPTNGVAARNTLILTYIQATAVLSLTDQPVDGETVMIGTIVFEFDNDASVSGTNIAVSIGADLIETGDNLVTQVNTYTGTEGWVYVTNNPDLLSYGVIIGGQTYGSAGNAIPVSEMLTNGSWDVMSGHLEGGSNPAVNGDTLTIGATVYTFGTDIMVDGVSPTDFFDVIRAAINTNSLTVIRSESLSASQASFDIDAQTKGAAGNSIALATTSANITPIAPLFTGGVDGTVASAGSLLYDGSWLYLCPLGNTLADANWLKVQLFAV